LNSEKVQAIRDIVPLVYLGEEEEEGRGKGKGKRKRILGSLGSFELGYC
jgi:hypothetical protein